MNKSSAANYINDEAIDQAQRLIGWVECDANLTEAQKAQVLHRAATALRQEANRREDSLRDAKAAL